MGETGKKRLSSVDILRAIGIIIMVAGHVGFGGKFDRYIHTFHMPLFFVLSGFLYRGKKDIPAGRLIADRARRLLVPYLFYGAVNYIFWFFLDRGTGESWYGPLIKLFTYNTDHLPICGALWFLTALFWCELVYILLDRLIKIPGVRIAVITVIAAGFAVMQNYTDIRLPLSFDNGMVCLLFYEAGRLAHDTKGSWGKFTDRLKPAVCMAFAVVLLPVTIGLAFVNSYVNIKSGWYGIIPLFYLNAILGTIMCLMAALFLDRAFKDKNVLKITLVNTGSGTMVFLGLNQLVILLLNRGCGAVTAFTGKELNFYPMQAIITVLALAVLYIILLTVRKIKTKTSKMLFGI